MKDILLFWENDTDADEEKNMGKLLFGCLAMSLALEHWCMHFLKSILSKKSHFALNTH